MTMLNRLLKIIFFLLIVRPLVLVVLGMNIVNRRNLPRRGPAVIAANHNSHLDAVVLMSLLPLRSLHKVRPVAAADYFLKSRLLAWFSLNIIGIVPVERGNCRNPEKYFSECHHLLDDGCILIIFPEGSRGEPEAMGRLKKGLFYLVKDRKELPVIPVVMHGLGMALPRGEALLVPFNCDVVVGDKLEIPDDSRNFLDQLGKVYGKLSGLCLTGFGKEYE